VVRKRRILAAYSGAGAGAGAGAGVGRPRMQAGARVEVVERMSSAFDPPCLRTVGSDPVTAKGETGVRFVVLAF
jgi:hypothetical protein